MRSNKGFTLVELMVVVAIVAILAAVAIPMYSSFRQKSKVGTTVNSAAGVMRALQGWYERNQTFSNITVDPNGGALRQNSGSGPIRVGSGLPAINNVTWDITNADDTTIRISWAFSAGCAAVCDGYYQMTCNPTNDVCNMVIFLDAQNTLGFNKP